MNRYTLVLLPVLLSLFCACHKTAQTPAETNKFTLKVNGTTFNAANNFTYNAAANMISQTPADYFMQATTSPYSATNTANYCTVTCNITRNFQCDFTAMSTTADPVGTYTVVNAGYNFYFVDSISGWIVYTIDSISTVTITESDSNWVAGNMNLLLINQGNHYPATGSFKITAR